MGRLLTNPNISNQQQIIAGLSMQKPPREAFITIARQALSHLQEASITPEVFRWITFPTYDWSTHFADKHKDPQVRAFQEEAAASAHAPPDTKDEMRQELVSGNARTQVRAMRARGEIK